MRVDFSKYFVITENDRTKRKRNYHRITKRRNSIGRAQSSSEHLRKFSAAFEMTISEVPFMTMQKSHPFDQKKSAGIVRIRGGMFPAAPRDAALTEGLSSALFGPSTGCNTRVS